MRTVTEALTFGKYLITDSLQRKTVWNGMERLDEILDKGSDVRALDRPRLRPIGGPSSNPASDPPIGTPSKNREEKNKLDPKEVDADYNAAMKRSRVTPPKVVSDPWQNVRTPSPRSDKK